jgi:cell division protein FtsB
MKATARRNELKMQSAEIEVENDEMRRRIDNKDSDEIIEEIAREDLNLVMPGEQVYYD